MGAGVDCWIEGFEASQSGDCKWSMMSSAKETIRWTGGGGGGNKRRRSRAAVTEREEDRRRLDWTNGPGMGLQNVEVVGGGVALFKVKEVKDGRVQGQ